MDIGEKNIRKFRDSISMNGCFLIEAYPLGNWADESMDILTDHVKEDAWEQISAAKITRVLAHRKFGTIIETMEADSGGEASRVGEGTAWTWWTRLEVRDVIEMIRASSNVQPSEILGGIHDALGRIQDEISGLDIPRQDRHKDSW